MAKLDAPATMDFSVGTTEQKMDMSLGRVSETFVLLRIAGVSVF